VFTTLHARLRVQRAPGIPHALFFEGERIFPKLGRSSRRENTIPRLDDAGQLLL
jgi:hypothetical protein